MKFLVFDDEHAVMLDKVVGFAALGEADIDPNTSKYRRPIPEGARTRVDTVSGYFWTTTAFEDIVERLTVVALQGADGE